MTPEDMKHVWETQTTGIQLTINAEQLEVETRRFQKQFTTLLFWRDIREIGIALLLIPLWLYLGQKFGLPWTWYLMVPTLVWIAGYMYADRLRNKPSASKPGESLRGCLESTLAQIENQIRLLQSVLWWCLIPVAIPMLAFFGHIAWLSGSMDSFTILFLVVSVLIAGAVLFAVQGLNQYVVRTDLKPRRDELKSQLLSIQEE